MKKRIWYIILGALLLFALLLGLWFWLFGGNSSTLSDTSDLFGSGTTTTSGGGNGGGGGNTQAPLGSTVGTNIQTPIGGGGGTTLTYGTEGSVTFSDAVWLDGGFGEGGSGSGGSGGAGSLFNPTPINALNSSNLSGTPYIVNSPSGGSSGTDLGLAAGLLGAAAGCVGNYLAAQGVALASSLFPNPLNFVVVQTNSIQGNNNQAAKAIIDCMVRSLARIAIRQITAETVNWINSGFDGKPQYVQNYQQFFTNVADQAAGSFIQGSNLSFLCSPFRIQVRVAIAQSYARRQSGAAQSCTLSGSVNNVERFLDGDFSQGGWPGLLSFTTTPTNNPFGAFMYAEVALNDTILTSTKEAERRITPGGFLSQRVCTKTIDEVTYNLDTASDCKDISPGAYIEGIALKTFGKDVDSLELANSIDEILDALVNSLIKKAFQGLASLGSNNGSASLGTQDIEATNAASTLLQELQAYVQYAQQYGSVAQGSIQDVQTAQGNLSALEGCWASEGSDSKQAAAAEKIAELELLVEHYNNQILVANAAVARAQELQSGVYLARSLADVQAVRAQLQAAQLSGQLITQTTVSLAQQDRTGLQSQMASVNADTTTKLQQCYEDSN